MVTAIVGNADDRPIILVAFDPFTDLHQSGTQHAYIDHIALDDAQLHPIPDSVKRDPQKQQSCTMNNDATP